MVLVVCSVPWNTSVVSYVLLMLAIFELLTPECFAAFLDRCLLPAPSCFDNLPVELKNLKGEPENTLKVADVNSVWSSASPNILPGHVYRQRAGTGRNSVVGKKVPIYGTTPPSSLSFISMPVCPKPALTTLQQSFRDLFAPKVALQPKRRQPLA